MIIKEKIKKEDLEVPFTKAVVDIERDAISIGCELHIDCAEELIRDGSSYPNLWGINIYPNGQIDFIALINIRVPDNRGLDIQNQEIRQKIEVIIKKFL